MLDRAAVQRGIAALGARGGETWFKVDAVGVAAMRRINNVAYQPETVLRRLRHCGELCSTWVQTCMFLLDGQPPAEGDLANYLALLGRAKDVLAGVHLYGLARPSLQPEAARLERLPPARIEELGARIAAETGLAVRVSP